jgi:Uma2 family endonuclease
MSLLATPSTKRVTPEELLGMPDNNGLELVDGQLVEKNVSAESSEIEGLFYFYLKSYLLDHPGIAGVFPASLGYRCFADRPDKIRKPDVTVVRLDRLKEMPDPNPGYMPIVPDLAVEVISPGDEVYEVDDKIREFMGAGFPLVWLADPNARTVTVHAQGKWPALLSAENELTAEGLLPGFRRKVDDFFRVESAKTS